MARPTAYHNCIDVAPSQDNLFDAYSCVVYHADLKRVRALYHSLCSLSFLCVHHTRVRALKQFAAFQDLKISVAIYKAIFAWLLDTNFSPQKSSTYTDN